MNRLYDAMEALGDYARIYSKARLKKEWIEKEYMGMKTKRTTV